MKKSVSEEIKEAQRNAAFRRGNGDMSAQAFWPCREIDGATYDDEEGWDLQDLPTGWTLGPILQCIHSGDTSHATLITSMSQIPGDNLREVLLAWSRGDFLQDRLAVWTPSEEDVLELQKEFPGLRW